jgi:hypothetical protein
MSNVIKLLGFAFALCVAGAAHAQSSKFAATYDTDAVMVDVAVDGSAGPTSDSAVTAEADLASLHVANWKELLIGVSAQANLVTFTQAKGKNGGGTSTAIAEGTVRVGVTVVPDGTANACADAWADESLFAAPGPVTFASRRQELSVTVDLDVVGSIPDYCDATCIEDNLDIDGSVTVALGLDTTAAHHFNFVAADLASGWYNIVACYDLSALAEVSGDDINADTAAYSKTAIGPRMVTVQEVRATKGGIIDESGSAN